MNATILSLSSHIAHKALRHFSRSTAIWGPAPKGLTLREIDALGESGLARIGRRWCGQVQVCLTAEGVKKRDEMGIQRGFGR